MPKVICLRLLIQFVWSALALARASAGSSIAARIAMMAITTSNSIRVNAEMLRLRVVVVSANDFISKVVTLSVDFLLGMDNRLFYFTFRRYPGDNMRDNLFQPFSLLLSLIHISEPTRLLSISY